MEWINDRPPTHSGFYLVTVERADGTRFTGYSYYDFPEGLFLTANKKFALDFPIIAWAEKPQPFLGPQNLTVWE